LPTIKTALKLAFTLGLLSWAFSRLDWSRLQGSWELFESKYLLLAAVFLFLSIYLAALRWSSFLKLISMDGNKQAETGLYFYGALLNQGLPTTMGGDAYKAIKKAKAPLWKEKIKLQDIFKNNKLELFTAHFIVILIDRLYGLIGVLLIGLFAIFLESDTYGYNLIVISYISSFCILLFMFCPKKLLERLTVTPWVRTYKTLGLTLLLLKETHAFIVAMKEFLRAILIHVLGAAAMFFCFKAVGMAISLEALGLSYAIANCLVVLPISIAGWGVRETSLISILSIWHYDTNTIVIGSLLFGIISIGVLLPGLYFLKFND